MKTRIEFKRIKQRGDGNCFFHSVSYLLHIHKFCGISHHELRRLVHNYYYINNNIERAKYIVKHGSWAEDSDVSALSNILKINIKIWEGKNNMWITFGNYKRKIYLYNEHNQHFDALIRLN